MVRQEFILKTEAIFSDDAKHRFLHHMEWDQNQKSVMIFLKNPYISDIKKLDESTVQIINHFNDLGFGSVYIVNLFSIITPRIRFWHKTLDDLIKPENDICISQLVCKVDTIVLAWGKDADKYKQVRIRQEKIINLLDPYKDRLYIISDAYGHTFLHPLSQFAKYEWKLERFINI